MEKERKRIRTFTKAEIKKAAQTDIIDFINSHGKGTLRGGGRYPKYYINGHGSLVIDRKHNYFYHNGQHKGDNVIRLLTDYEGYSFPQAVALLLGEELEQHTPYIETEEDLEFTYSYIKDETTTQAANYLIQVRGIDQEIVSYLVENDYLIQDKRYKNAVLNWKKFGLPEEEIIGATSIVTKKSISDSPSKYIAKNSEKHYGFNITLGQPKAVYFFEASIDLLSYWSLNKDLNDCRLICLEGLKDKTIIKTIQETYQKFGMLPSEGIYYGVDNDPAGHHFFDSCDKNYNFRKEAGKEELITNQSLIPYNNQIQKEIYDQALQAATTHGVDKNLLLTIQKIENNLTMTNKISNGWKAYGFFADSPNEHAKAQEIQLDESLEKVCQAIKEKQVTIDTIADLYRQNDLTLLEEKLLKDRASELYMMYDQENIDVVYGVSKDWNDYLKEQRSEGLITEKQPLNSNFLSTDRIRSSIPESFTYYLQDSKTNDVVRTTLINKYQADPMIVDALIKKRLIREDDNQRIVYLWKDGENVSGGQVTGTIEDKSYGRSKIEQKILDASRPGYGFNVTLGTPDEIYFFQSPEDLLSYWTLHKNTIDHSILFALSDDSPRSMINLLNEKLEQGVSFKQVNICINKDKAGLALIDEITKLEAFDRKERTLTTDKGKQIPIKSVRPILGINWQDEVQLKKERVKELSRFQGGPTVQQQVEQQLSISR
ncbi:hypothetical protein IGJ28_003486 [Enterococcus sp. AZ091]|uniref:DUF3991 domain-containing protein n=1 Tax=Enterococcus sp. AZ091 TaxID=2774720 RepID=UPI003F23B337